jgi:tight adherence protein C
MNSFLLLAQVGLSLVIAWLGIRLIKRFSQAASLHAAESAERVSFWPAWARRFRLMVMIVAPLSERFVRSSADVQRELSMLGHDPRFDDREFSRLRVSSAFLALLVAFVVGLVVKRALNLDLLDVALWSAVAGLFVFMVMRVRLKDRYRVAQNRISSALPSFLDVLALTLESGHNFQGAVQISIRQMPNTARSADLKLHLQELMRDLRSGSNRSSALQKFSDRLVMPEITQFVASILTAERQGASISGILRRQSEQLRISRALAAERVAMKAPVKLLAPLAICIFPCTFAVLMFPIAVRLMESGMF